MTEKLKQKIKEKMSFLPIEAQQAISSVDWGSISEEIGKKYLLNESEVNDLQVLTGLAIVGIGDINSFVNDIENEVGASKDEAEKINKEVFEKIFSPIANELEKIIKNKMKDKDPKWDENLGFILSGGNYAIFMPIHNTNDKETLLVNFLKKQ